MRTLKIFTLLIAGLFIFNACGKEKSPEEVAMKFLQLTEENKFEEAKKFGTSDTKQLLDLSQSLVAMNAGFEDDESIAPAKIENMECVVEDDKAICSYTIDGEFDQLPLVKQNGKWLVDLKKESPFDDMDFDWEEEEEVEEVEEEEIVEVEEV